MAGDAAKRIWACFAVLLLAVALMACGGADGRPGDHTGDRPSAAQDMPGAGRPPVTLGTKNFTEQFILGELYAQALEARGWTVDLKADIGSSEVADRALTSGKIDLYPEYTGTTLSVVKGQTKVPRTAEATYRQAKAFYARRGQVLLDRTPFEDRDAIAVTRQFSERHGLHTTADLANVDGHVTIGAAPEFRTRFAGLVGLRREYGLTNLRFAPLTIGGTYPALDKGRIDAADVFTTDGQLASGRYVVLEDPKGIFGYQNLAPVVSQKVLKRQGQAFARTLNAVSARLTNEAMQKMNAAVALDHKRPAEVARQFLRANGLL
jgi:osmoprotectant transport system substrate-binding protein